MSFNHVVGFSIDPVGRGTITRSKTYSASFPKSLEETVADSQTDFPIIFELDVSATKSFYIVSDQDVTIETNDGTTPDDTISLLAGVPYVWTEDSYDTFLLGTDVTQLLVTNASGETATIQIEALVDATP